MTINLSEEILKDCLRISAMKNIKIIIEAIKRYIEFKTAYETSPNMYYLYFIPY